MYGQILSHGDVSGVNRLYLGEILASIVNLFGMDM